VTPQPGFDPTDRHSAAEFTLEHALAGLTHADHVRRSERHRIPGRPRIDVHHHRQHRPGTHRLVRAATWHRDPGHRTSIHRPRSDHGGDGDGDDPPF
jgi:hypothetical protein